MIATVVSTHSRPKAAGPCPALRPMETLVSTHSRPKAAGSYCRINLFWFNCFNTQPPEGGWSTAEIKKMRLELFQHTAARRRLAIGNCRTFLSRQVSTHSRPKAAGFNSATNTRGLLTFQHTAARRRLGLSDGLGDVSAWFQHTAARRRLERGDILVCLITRVSTHSRPKAAGASLKSLATSGFAALISLSSQEKRKREYNTAFSVTPAFAIS